MSNPIKASPGLAPVVIPATLYYFTRSVYGDFLTYLDTSTPERAEIAEAFRKLTGSKTLQSHHEAALEALGFTLFHVQDPLGRTSPLRETFSE